MKNKLIYPIYGILLIFLLSIGKLAISKEPTTFPGTRWLEVDSYIGASKNYTKNDIKVAEIEKIDFTEDITIPDLPNLPDVPLTEEDK
tara:strand:+ start:226 stop:489 length:264 start_codon:yes stop_codon:yes gene_type:complete